jgi:hypothetical protein
LLVSREEANLFYEELLKSLNNDSKIPAVSYEHWRNATDNCLLKEAR